MGLATTLCCKKEEEEGRTRSGAWAGTEFESGRLLKPSRAAASRLRNEAARAPRVVGRTGSESAPTRIRLARRIGATAPAEGGGGDGGSGRYAPSMARPLPDRAARLPHAWLRQRRLGEGAVLKRKKEDEDEEEEASSGARYDLAGSLAARLGRRLVSGADSSSYIRYLYRSHGPDGGGGREPSSMRGPFVQFLPAGLPRDDSPPLSPCLGVKPGHRFGQAVGSTSWMGPRPGGATTKTFFSSFPLDLSRTASDPLLGLHDADGRTGGRAANS
ncbi:hypothetical protein CDD83_936 [Cordyceps sp. RAO-2017]|nr:hypothetical protein CDD83_936 [Cordyceps sp. RAO-2017]